MFGYIGKHLFGLAIVLYAEFLFRGMHNGSGGTEKTVHFLSLSFTSVGKNKENISYPPFIRLKFPSYMRRL
jgi:hypothetical protein